MSFNCCQKRLLGCKEEEEEEMEEKRLWDVHKAKWREDEKDFDYRRFIIIKEKVYTILVSISVSMFLITNPQFFHVKKK